MTKLDNLPKGLVFVDQYDRMLRWYKRLQKINEGKPESCGQALNDFDEILVFFIICYHLRDWLIQDVAVEETDANYTKFLILKRDIDNFINCNDCLCLCVDICNSAKHRNLVKPPRFHEKTEVCPGLFEITSTGTGQICKQNWELVTESGKMFDLFEISTECVRKWSEFLTTHKIQIQELTPYWRDEHETVSYDPMRVEGNVIGSNLIKVHRVKHNER
jgi:hypothetical protein